MQVNQPCYHSRMLSVFPIQFLSMLAHLILRVCVGLILVYLGLTHWKIRQELGAVMTYSWWPLGILSAMLFAIGELIFGVMIIAGYHMQVATLFIALMSLKIILLRGLVNHPSVPSRMFYFLLFGATISLTITGAGAWAFDLPI